MSFVLIGYNWKSHPQTILIAGIFIIYSFYSVLYYFTIEFKNDFIYAILFGHLTPLWYLPGPLLYFYYRSTLRNSRIFISWTDSLHFIPTIVQFGVMLPYYVIPFSEKLQIAHLIHENPDLVQHYTNIYTLYSATVDFVSRPLFLAIYIFVCFYLLFKYRVQSNNHRYTLRWLYLFLILLLLENILYSVTIYLLINNSFGFSFELVQQMHNVTGAGFFVIPILLLCFFPQIVYGRENSKFISRKTTTAPTQEVSFFELSERINTYMRKKQAYLNPDLDISDISFALKVPRHHIAYCFTNVLESKFSSFKNRLRIEHAKKLLEDGEAQLNSIDGIGAKSGFKSRSSFYEAFKVETGITPNQYIKNLAK